MPSPFPGMDPYLEDPHHWPGVHMQIISEMQAELNRRLLPRYFAAAEDRVYISDEEDTGRKAIVPDVRILPTGSKKKPTGGKTRNPSAATVCEPVSVTVLFEEEIHEPYLRVIEYATQQVITVIEVLSPTNKVNGSQGRADYTAKRSDILASETNWVEIDLLREGEPVITRELYPQSEYTVHISRAIQRPKAVVWPIRLQQRLPVIPIPLKGKEADAELDLQSILAAAYLRGAFQVRLNYTEDPVPALPPDLARWANKLLKQKKLR